jgi:1-acyl-sn-glycerol-3-phosphate acyltransferase
MCLTPHIDADDPAFPGDPTPQPPFGVADSLRSLFLWSIGLFNLFGWMWVVRAIPKLSDYKQADFLLKAMCKVVPRSLGVKIDVVGGASLRPHTAYVYVVNHVNIFDMFAIYSAVPGYTRSLEHIDHFSWPVIGPLITAAGQIPVDPNDRRVTAKGIRAAIEMLKRGESLVVLPEGSRTLDGSVGRFYPGAFRIAVKGGADIVPMAIKGGRRVNRRGDWRVRPGRETVLIGKPISVADRTLSDVDMLADTARSAIIDLLQERCPPDVGP